MRPLADAFMTFHAVQDAADGRRATGAGRHRHPERADGRFACQNATDHTEGTRRAESLRPFSRARAHCGRSACLAPYGLGRPRPTLRDRQPCTVAIDGITSTILSEGQCRTRAATGLASSGDRRRSTPTRRAHSIAGRRNACAAIPRADFLPCDPCCSENPRRIGAPGMCR